MPPALGGVHSLGAEARIGVQVQRRLHLGVLSFLFPAVVLLVPEIKAYLSSSAPFSREDLDQEEKAKFGEYCSSVNGKRPEWFARYVSASVRG